MVQSIVKLWTGADFRLLRQYWHTEQEHVTAERLGISRKACYMAASRLRQRDPEFDQICLDRDDDYQFLVIGNHRALIGNFRGWTEEQQDILWRLWHTMPDAEASNLIGKDKRACSALARRLRHRDNRFARLMNERQAEYDRLVEAARKAHAVQARWQGHVKAPKPDRKVRSPNAPNHLFVERFLTPNHRKSV